MSDVTVNQGHKPGIRLSQRLPSVGTIVLLTACVLVALYVADHTVWGNRGSLISSGSDLRRLSDTKSEITSWLTQQGFVEVASPIGKDAWGGIKVAGDTDTWFKGRFGDSPEFFVIIRQDPGRRSRIHTYVWYHIRGLSWRLDAYENRIQGFVPVLNEWFEQREKKT